MKIYSISHSQRSTHLKTVDEVCSNMKGDSDISRESRRQNTVGNVLIRKFPSCNTKVKKEKGILGIRQLMTHLKIWPRVWSWRLEAYFNDILFQFSARYEFFLIFQCEFLNQTFIITILGLFEHTISNENT